MFQMDARLTVGYLMAQKERRALQCAVMAADCAPYCTALQAGILPCETICILRLQAPKHSGSDDQFDPALLCWATINPIMLLCFTPIETPQFFPMGFLLLCLKCDQKSCSSFTVYTWHVIVLNSLLYNHRSCQSEHCADVLDLSLCNKSKQSNCFFIQV